MVETIRVEAAQVSMGTVAFVKAVDYRKIYANQIQIGLTPFDFQLALVQASVGGGTPSNEVQATVFLAPVEAKVLASLLTKVIGEYEKQYGIIPALPQLITPAQQAPVAGT